MPSYPVNVAADSNPFVSPHASDAVANYGKTSTPAQMNGEGLEHTPYATAVGMARSDITLPSGRKWDEPGVPVSASTQGSLWQTYHGGSYVELGGGINNEFINIIHKSGSRITIASDGSVTISGAGDVVLTSDGNSVEVFDGAKEAKYSAGYNIGVTGGKTTINSAGPIVIGSGQDITLAAGGKINLNASNGIDIAGARVAITARVDTLDLYSTGKMALESGSRGMHMTSAEGLNFHSKKKLHILADDKMVVQGKGLDLKGGGGNITAVGSKVYLNSPGFDGDDAEAAVAANKTSLGAAPAYTVDVTAPVSFSLGDIQAGDVDDV